MTHLLSRDPGRICPSGSRYPDSAQRTQVRSCRRRGDVSGTWLCDSDGAPSQLRAEQAMRSPVRSRMAWNLQDSARLACDRRCTSASMIETQQHSFALEARPCEWPRARPQVASQPACSGFPQERSELPPTRPDAPRERALARTAANGATGLHPSHVQRRQAENHCATLPARPRAVCAMIGPRAPFPEPFSAAPATVPPAAFCHAGTAAAAPPARPRSWWHPLSLRPDLPATVPNSRAARSPRSIRLSCHCTLFQHDRRSLSPNVRLPRLELETSQLTP
mmetsp:Transcript_34300/g.91657  ORF Transcript_34300/g.91657 Transcript_34300/m.91657 type:complete len:279 (-) Transcript_34300:29-865(-)